MLGKNVWTKLFFVGMILVVVLTGCSSKSNDVEQKQTLKLGVLPTEDSLPLVVADQKGYFDEKNIDVELVTFQSAVESQSAIQSGQIDGMITDIVVASLLKDSGLNVKITSITYGASPERRRFAIVAAPKSGIEKLEDLKDKSVGISNNSIIEYVTDRLVEDSGISNLTIKKSAIPKIPVRLEMLINNQIDAVNIPEPLVTFAEFQGAKVIADDTKNVQLSQAVLIMNEKALNKGLKDFYEAYSQAVKDINTNPDQFKDVFVKNSKVPEPIIKDYKVPTYPEPQLPTEESVKDVMDWLNGKGLLKKTIEYKDLVQTGLY